MAEKEEKKSIVEILNKKYGKGTIIGGKEAPDSLQVVDTGSLGLNIATGVGGNPRGKLIEIFGPESSGKSTLTLHFIAEFQKAGDKCLLVDFEQSFDKKYATAIGVDVDALVIAQPESMEDGYNIIYEVVKSGEFKLVVLDSQTAMPPKASLESEIGDAKMALQARVNNDALRKIKPNLMPTGTTMIIISQLRSNIGGYGNPDIPSGGNAMKFYCDLRYRVSKQLDKEHEQNKTTVEVIKNKCASPFGKAEFKIEWGTGISRLQEIIDFAVEYDFLKKGGAGWYTVVHEGKESKMQGDDNLKVFMAENPSYALELETKVLNKLKEI